MMFRVDPDAWATVIAVLIVSISIFISIARKLERKVKRPSIYWLVTEIGISMLTALIAFEIYPNLVTLLPPWMTKNVFMALSIWMGAKFIQKLERKIKF